LSPNPGPSVRLTAWNQPYSDARALTAGQMTVGDIDTPARVNDAIDIVLRRFAESCDLQGAFGGRATVQRVKGILMEPPRRRRMAAFAALREHSRADNRKLLDVATAAVDAHRLLTPTHLGRPAVRPPEPTGILVTRWCLRETRNRELAAEPTTSGSTRSRPAASVSYTPTASRERSAFRSRATQDGSAKTLSAIGVVRIRGRRRGWPALGRSCARPAR
jgi:ANTAR domain